MKHYLEKFFLHFIQNFYLNQLFGALQYDVLDNWEEFRSEIGWIDENRVQLFITDEIITVPALTINSDQLLWTKIHYHTIKDNLEEFLYRFKEESDIRKNEQFELICTNNTPGIRHMMKGSYKDCLDALKRELIPENIVKDNSISSLLYIELILKDRTYVIKQIDKEN